jgi:hypothetical protein
MPLRLTSTAAAAISCSTASLPAPLGHLDAMPRIGLRGVRRRGTHGRGRHFEAGLYRDLRMKLARGLVAEAMELAGARGIVPVVGEQPHNRDMEYFGGGRGPLLIGRPGEVWLEFYILEMWLRFCLTHK